MRKIEQEQPEGFSFYPDRVKTGSRGHEIERANPYVTLASLTVGKIHYTPKDNKYWVAPGKECSKELLEKKFLPYLRWQFDEIEVDSKTGKAINHFPATPENIELKRSELVDEAIKETGRANFEEIEAMTCPHTLLNLEEVERTLDKGTPAEQMVRHLSKL